MNTVNRYPLLAAQLLLLLFCLIWPQTAVAMATPSHLLVGQMQVLEDPSAAATFDQILARRTEFTDINAKVLNYGFSVSAYWLRIPVQNGNPAAATFYLDVKNQLLDYVTLYLVVDGHVHSTLYSGAQMPAQLRPYLAPTLVFPFALSANQAADLYVRIQSSGATLQIPFALMAERELHASVTFGWVLNSMLVSMLAAMFLYNLSLLTLLRNRLYLYYVLYLFFAAMAVATVGGIGPGYFFPNGTWLSNVGIPFSTAIAFAFMILITQEVLVSQVKGWLKYGMTFLTIFALTVGVGSFFWSLRFNYEMLLLMDFVYPCFCFFAGMRALRQGYTEARFLIIGQISSWVGLFLTGLLGMNLLPYHPLMYQSAAIGAVADALLLSLALADRIRVLQRDRITAEEQARRNLEIRSEELARLVAERTAEIKTLRGILPICANCKKIRTDDGAWQALESYLSQHTDAQFSHGICADCMQELYPEIQRKRQQKTVN